MRGNIYEKNLICYFGSAARGIAVCVRQQNRGKNFVAGANRYSRSNSYTVTDSYSHCGTYTRTNTNTNNTSTSVR